MVETLAGSEGSISIIGSVSPPGGDFSEPVTQHTKRFVRCTWALDRQLANARHYPAISWVESYSEYVPDVTDWWDGVDPQWHELRETAMQILQSEDRLQQIVKLVGPDVLPDTQKLVLLTADIIKNGFLQQNAFDEIDMYSTPEKQVVLLKSIVRFHQHARRLIERGAPLTQIRELEVVALLMRAKSQIPNNSEKGLNNLLFFVDQQLSELEREYQ